MPSQLVSVRMVHLYLRPSPLILKPSPPYPFRSNAGLKFLVRTCTAYLSQTECHSKQHGPILAALCTTCICNSRMRGAAQMEQPGGGRALLSKQWAWPSVVHGPDTSVCRADHIPNPTAATDFRALCKSEAHVLLKGKAMLQGCLQATYIERHMLPGDLNP